MSEMRKIMILGMICVCSRITICWKEMNEVLCILALTIETGTEISDAIVAPRLGRRRLGEFVLCML